MLLSRSKKFLFVKGKKVAGTSIEVHLAPQLDGEAIVTKINPVGPPTHIPRNYELNGLRFYNHMPAHEIAQAIGRRDYDNLKSWGLVRDPFEKILSFYFMEFHRRGADFTLDDAIENCDTEATRYCDETGALLVQHIFRYEELSAVLPSFLSQFGLTAAGLDSVREKGHYRTLYSGPPIQFSAEQRRKIEYKFRFDLYYY